MTISRRAFLREGPRFVAALAAGPMVWRLRTCNANRRVRVGDRASGSVCAGQTKPAGPIEPAKPPLHPDALARFVDPLPIPKVLAPDSRSRDPGGGEEVAHYRVSMRETEWHVHRDLPATRGWGYEGMVPGPTFEVRKGQAIVVEWSNDLPTRHLLPIDHSLHGAHAEQPDVRAIVHVHGGRTPPESDGYPENWVPPGRVIVSRYPNEQDAATLWYHDHAMGIERLNQYAGLFGAYLIRDDIEDALGLPAGTHEAVLFLSDRLFTADGQLHYPTSGVSDMPWVSEVNGDAILINGKLFPYFEVEPRPYRLRLFNASNSRFYNLALPPAVQARVIGTDQGLLPAPAGFETLTLAPGERADIVVDFGGMPGERILLKSQALELMQFRIAAGPRVAKPIPPALRPMKRNAAAAAVRTRTLTLNEYEDPKTHQMLMLLNATRWTAPVTERPLLDSLEIWEFVNLTEDSHPIHLHLVRFEILDRQLFDADEFLTSGTMKRMGKPVSPASQEAGWKDTVRADPGLVTRILVRFDGYAGRYVWHCHVLEHAANEMMRPFEIVGRMDK